MTDRIQLSIPPNQYPLVIATGGQLEEQWINITGAQGMKVVDVWSEDQSIVSSEQLLARMKSAFSHNRVEMLPDGVVRIGVAQSTGAPHVMSTLRNLREGSDAGTFGRVVKWAEGNTYAGRTVTQDAVREHPAGYAKTRTGHLVTVRGGAGWTVTVETSEDGEIERVVLEPLG